MSGRDAACWGKQEMTPASRQGHSLITALSCEFGDERWVAVMNLKSRNGACIFSSSRNRKQSDAKEDEARDRNEEVRTDVENGEVLKGRCGG